MTHPRPAARALRLGAIATAAALMSGAFAASPAAALSFGPVSTETELLDAVADANAAAGPHTITLASGVAITTTATLELSESVTLDLGGGSLTAAGLLVGNASDVEITDGTLTSTGSESASMRAGIGVESTSTLTIRSATVTATGVECGAGIGGYTPTAPCNTPPSVSAGSVIIVDSTVTATGGTNAAGIGSSVGGAAGTVSITNSTVTASGGSNGAGIGSGSLAGAPGAISITSSTVTAQGGFGAAGIGGGYLSPGTTVTITDNSLIDARGGLDGSGIGGGDARGAGNVTITDSAVTALGSNADGIGHGNGSGDSVDESITLAGSGTLETNRMRGAATVASGAEYSIPGPSSFAFIGSLTNNGTIEAGTDFEVPTNQTMTNNGALNGGGLLLGEGTVVNNGSICIASIQIEGGNPVDPDLGVTVTGNNFDLPYSSGIGNRVLAATMQEGCRSFPDASVAPSGDDPGLIAVGWTLTENGTGDFVTETTALIDVAPTRTGTFYPTLVPAAITVTPSATTVAAGELVTLTVEGPLAESNEPISDLTDVVAFGDVGQDAGPNPGELSFTAPGVYTVPITMTYFLGFFSSFDVTTEAVITVETGALDAVVATPSASTVNQGDSITLTVTGQDAFGNSIPIDPADVTITSSVATDIIDGLRVSFPTASPHVLTVTVGEVSTQVTIEVSPALAATGASDPGTMALMGLLLLVLGGAAVAIGRASRTASPA